MSRALVAISLWLLGGTLLGQDAAVVRVGSKASIENIVLGEMLTQLVRSSGTKAEYISSLGGTQFVYRALQKGEIDIYPEYTGTLIAEIVGSSRVDLQACKLEYSIVSPK